MKRLLFSTFCALGLSLFAASSEDAFSVSFPKQRILEMLSNRDVYWAHEYPGLVPYLSPNAEAVLRGRDSPTGKTLRTWLEDPNRFVIAHVLLTLSDETGRYPVSASDWNSLRVNITEEGEARYDTTQMKALQQKWDNSSRVRSPEVKSR